jgi:hypothetical protein
MTELEALKAVLTIAEANVMPATDDEAQHKKEVAAIEVIEKIISSVEATSDDEKRQMAEETLAEAGMVCLMYMPTDAVLDAMPEGLGHDKSKFTPRMIREAVDKATEEVAVPDETGEWYEDVAEKACTHLPEFL